MKARETRKLARRSRPVWFAVILWLVVAPGALDAQPPAPLAIEDLARVSELVPKAEFLLDETKALSIEQVLRPTFQKRFTPAPRGMSFGFNTAALWVRFTAQNGGARVLRWALEIDYPLLDYVSLYVVPEHGDLEVHRTGDMLPFEAREISAPNFVFALESPPRSITTYYLRVQTVGSLRVPLFARSLPSYVGHQLAQNRLLWMFYGALVVMALFNFGVYVLIRQSEYLIYTLLLVTLGLVQCGLAGHASEFVFPGRPLLANRLLPVSVALVIVLVPAFAWASFRYFDEFARATRIAKVAVGPALLLLLFVSLSPLGLALRGVMLVAVVLAAVGSVLLVMLIRRRNKQLDLYLWSWYCLVIAAPIHVLRSASLIPSLPFTDFAVQIGITAHGVITSLALATRLKVARDQLGQLNAQLSSNVTELRSALSRAEEATESATRARLAKDRFLATMSHELRTPLNTIINVPQGLLEDFSERPGAQCRACGTRFRLEADETLSEESVCLECGAPATLVEKKKIRYTGDAAETAHFLRKIERSGKHLLQMVNGILDLSKLEAQRLELVRAPVDVEALLRETLDEMAEHSRQKGLSLTLTQSGTPAPLFADPVRLKQVLLNLLSNAIKFSEPGGVVRVGWECRDDADVIWVRDQGIGIATEHQARIFDSFEQVHTGDTRRYGGTGLGLSISRSLVRMHGGEIWVQSTVGKGATFSFTIPRPASSPRAMDAVEHEERGGVEGSPHA